MKRVSLRRRCSLPPSRTGGTRRRRCGSATRRETLAPSWRRPASSDDVPYKIDWKEFPAAAPLLEALSAGAIEDGLVGDAPFTFAAAAKVPVKAIAAIRQTAKDLRSSCRRASEIKDASRT